jgi:hypothetical protein
VAPLADFVIELGGDSGLNPQAQRAALLLLAAMLASFLFIRTSARLMRSPKVPWWPGSVTTEGGLHVHHLVFGIVLMLLAGFVMSLQPDSPWFEITAAAFGIGAGLTLDEFALWLHLEDVYWAEEGRRSVDAVVVATLIGGLVITGFAPFSADEGVPTVIVSVLIALALSAVAVLKGKLFLGIAGMLFPLASLVGAIRLAEPDSWWARRRYPPGSAKLARANERHVRHRRRYQRLQDRVAGAPGPQEPSPPGRPEP